jgi:hypothetical protein
LIEPPLPFTGTKKRDGDYQFPSEWFSIHAFLQHVAKRFGEGDAIRVLQVMDYLP